MGERIGIVGGGTMGAGIAHALLAADAEVVLVERGPEEADAARSRVRASLHRAADRGRLERGPEELFERLQVAVGVPELDGCRLVIEAVPERADLKHPVLRAIEQVVAPDAVIGSNTSSLSIDGLASVLDRPDRFVGTHFFNPVPASQLLEVVRGSATADSTVAAVTALAARLGLESVLVDDAPGFATSRLGVALGLEAIRMLEDGVASAEDIDTAMRLGYKHPIGPLRLTDLVGLDVRLGIADHLQRELGDRFAPPQLLRDKVAAGELGRKSGRGFFTWDEGEA